MANDESAPLTRSAEITLAEARWHREDQRRRQEALYQRIAMLFTLNFGVLAILGASLQLGPAPLSGFVEYFAYATMFVLTANVSLLLWALLGRQIVIGPVLRRLSEASETYEEAQVQTWLIGELIRSFYENERRLTRATLWVRRAVLMSFVGVVLVATTVALSLHLAGT